MPNKHEDIFRLFASQEEGECFMFHFTNPGCAPRPGTQIQDERALSEHMAPPPHGIP
jgi:hypothetical protein